MWSSAQDAYAGPELVDYLPESLVAQWTKKRTLLGADARSCTIPREVFAAGTPMVQMVAYGSQRTISQPGWRVHVRSKSTAMLDRKSVVKGKSGSVRVDLGGARIHKKKKKKQKI